jgi:hypothetical protein
VVFNVGDYLPSLFTIWAGSCFPPPLCFSSGKSREGENLTMHPIVSKIVVTIAGLTALVLSTPVGGRAGYRIKETHPPPSKWRRLGPAPSDYILHLQIGLRQGRFHELESYLQAGKEASQNTVLSLT